MKRFLQALLVIAILAAPASVVHAQKRAEHTSSGRAAYGNSAPEFKANKKRNQKAKKKARQAAKSKKSRNNKTSYFRGRPY